MTTTSIGHAEVAVILRDIIRTVPHLRCDWYVADKSRPPVAVIGLPDVQWNDPDAGFCHATWVFPVTIIVARPNDLKAQEQLSDFVRDVSLALDNATPTGVFSVEPLDARPTTATVAGNDQPAYELTVRVRA